MTATTRTASLALIFVLVLSSIWFASPASAAAPCTTPPTGGGEWPMYGHDLANTRTQPDETGLGLAAVTSLKPLWVFSTSSTGDGTGFNTTSVVYDGCVFIGSFGGTAYALDANPLQLYNVRAMPTTIFFTANGSIQEQVAGLLQEDRLRSSIQKLVAPQ